MTPHLCILHTLTRPRDHELAPPAHAPARRAEDRMARADAAGGRAAPLRWLAIAALPKDQLLEGLLGALDGRLPDELVERIRKGRCDLIMRSRRGGAGCSWVHWTAACQMSWWSASAKDGAT
eukprot:63238-Chlamydomonas_euryale.AAC.1